MTTASNEISMDAAGRRTAEDERAQHWRAEEAVMKWYGWGSPVGMSIMLVSVGVCAVLIRHALFG